MLAPDAIPERLDLRSSLQAPPRQILSSQVHLKEMACGLFSDHSDDEATTTGPGLPSEEAASRSKPKTKKDRAREARRKAQEHVLAEKQALKAQRRNVDNSKQLNAEIDKQEQQKTLRRQRREVRLWLLARGPHAPDLHR